MKNEKDLVKINNSVNKSFNYSKGGVSLDFSLRIDIKKDLNDFLELLKVAVREVEEELNKK